MDCNILVSEDCCVEFERWRDDVPLDSSPPLAVEILDSPECESAIDDAVSSSDAWSDDEDSRGEISLE